MYRGVEREVVHRGRGRRPFVALVLLVRALSSNSAPSPLIGPLHVAVKGVVVGVSVFGY